MSAIVDKRGVNGTALSDLSGPKKQPHRHLLPSAIAAIDGLGKPLETPPLTLEERDVQNRSGGIWECLGREMDPASDGYFYVFNIRPELNDLPSLQEEDGLNRWEPTQTEIAILKKGIELFPALERFAREILYLDAAPASRELWTKWYTLQTANPEEKIQRILGSVPVLHQLGYDCSSREDGVYLKLPDITMLHHRWNKLREVRPELPELKLISSEGIAGHLEFIDAYLNSAGVLSSGKEFVHDHQYHIIPTIMMLLDTDTVFEGEKISYSLYKTRVADWVKEACDAVKKQKPNAKDQASIDKYNVLEAALGGVVDNLSASNSYKSALKIMADPIVEELEELLLSPKWVNYLLTKANCTREALGDVLIHIAYNRNSPNVFDL